MPTLDPIDDSSDEGSIDANRKNPRQVETDEGSVSQHRLPDQVEAERYLFSRQIAKNPLQALTITGIKKG